MPQDGADTPDNEETAAELLARAQRARWHADHIGDKELALKIIQFAEELQARAAACGTSPEGS